MPTHRRSDAAHRVSRRSALALGAGVAAAGAAMMTGGAALRPAVQNGVIKLVFQPNVQGVNTDATLIRIFQDYTDANFNRQHPGVRAMVDPGGWGNPTSQITAAIAGTGGDDVVASDGNYLAAFASSGWAIPLDSYMKQDNVSASLWSSAHMAALNFGGQQMALPSYDGPAVVTYRQDLLDQLGLKYPDPTWTYADALTLWEQCSGQQKSGWRYGLACPDDVWLNSEHFQVWVNGWGGQVSNSTFDQAYTAGAKAVAGVAYAANLLNKKLAASLPGNDVQPVAIGQSVFSFTGGWNTFHLAAQLVGVKWDLLPVPNWPAGRATFNNSDFYAILRTTKNPEMAWELIKWLTAEPGWQRMQMQTTLVTPCLISLWDEWQAIVQNVAPPLRGKQLQWFKDAALHGYNYPGVYWRYAATGAAAIVDSWLSKIRAGTVSVALGMNQIQKQVNAIEASGATSQAVVAKEQSQYAAFASAVAKSSSPVATPAPAVLGSGLQGVPAPKLLTAASGTYSVAGAGGDGITNNGSNDAFTYAAAAVTSSQGTFTCRLVSLSVPKGTTLSTFQSSGQPKVGLMARADFANAAACVFLNVTGGHGMHLQSRPVEGVVILDTSQPPSTQAAGLLGSGQITAGSSTYMTNYLLKPIWLRLQRSGSNWTAFTSLDGQKWTNVGSRVMECAGAWIGFAVTSYTSGQYVTASFDNVTGFSPAKVMQVGIA